MIWTQKKCEMAGLIFYVLFFFLYKWEGRERELWCQHCFQYLYNLVVLKHLYVWYISECTHTQIVNIVQVKSRDAKYKQNSVISHSLQAGISYVVHGKLCLTVKDRVYFVITEKGEGHLSKKCSCFIHYLQECVIYVILMCLTELASSGLL